MPKNAFIARLAVGAALGLALVFVVQQNLGFPDAPTGRQLLGQAAGGPGPGGYARYFYNACDKIRIEINITGCNPPDQIGEGQCPGYGLEEFFRQQVDAIKQTNDPVQLQNIKNLIEDVFTNKCSQGGAITTECSMTCPMCQFEGTLDLSESSSCPSSSSMSSSYSSQSSSSSYNPSDPKYCCTNNYTCIPEDSRCRDGNRYADIACSNQCRRPSSQSSQSSSSSWSSSSSSYSYSSKSSRSSSYSSKSSTSSKSSKSSYSSSSYSYSSSSYSSQSSVSSSSSSDDSYFAIGRIIRALAETIRVILPPLDEEDDSSNEEEQPGESDETPDDSRSPGGGESSESGDESSAQTSEQSSLESKNPIFLVLPDMSFIVEALRRLFGLGN